MLYAYTQSQGGLSRLEPPVDLRQAIWIDLMVPTAAEIAAMADLGVEIPTLADMEEIEISNRLYREGDLDTMTAVLPGERAGGERSAMPVAFILSSARLVTVRHHSPRPFLTYPSRAARGTLGCASPDRLFCGLLEEIISRLADILEGSGRVLDEAASGIFEQGQQIKGRSDRLRETLRLVGREADLMARVRLGLLTVERILAFYNAIVDDRPESGKLKPVIKAQLRDVQALEVHADFLSQRVSLTVDTTLGMINLEQNNTVRILSVVAALFLPPTLIASIYGMNFSHMPELDTVWGYPMSLLLMLGTSGATYVFLRWKKWL